MSFKGMNPDEGREVAQLLNTTGSDMASAIADAGTIVSGVEWLGPDYDAFLDDWNNFQNGAVANLEQVLVGKGDELNKHADEQDETSNQG